MSRVYVAGVACSGKTTLARHLRDAHGVNAIDMDDEILRLNGGTWPDIETKNNIVKPKVLDEVLAMREVILLYGPMRESETTRLRQAGFLVLLLDVSPAELMRRDAMRLAEEGWSNIEWFDHHQAELARFRESGLIDFEISGMRGVEEVAVDILQLADGGSDAWTV